MSNKFPLRDIGVVGEKLQPAMAEMLLAALNEHEMTLARVARQLHDDVSQVLSAAGLQLDALRMDFREATPGVDQRAAEIQEMLEQAIERLRSISNELNPSIAERAGLHFALDQMAGKARGSFQGAIRLHFDSNPRVPSAAAKTFSKIAELGLDAAMARPGCSVIEIHFKQSHGELVLEIADDAAVEHADTPSQALDWLLLEYQAAQNHFAVKRSEGPGPGNTLRASCPAAGANN